MSDSRLLRFAAALLAAAGAPSCASPAGPDELAGVYVLRMVGPDSLPAVVSSNENVTIFALADTLRLGSNGAGVQTGARRVLPATGAPVDTVRIEWPFRYEVVLLGRIEISYVCPPNANCIAGPHLIGQRTTDGLRLEGTFGDGPPLLYERLSLFSLLRPSR